MNFFVKMLETSVTFGLWSKSTSSRRWKTTIALLWKNLAD